MCSFAQIPVTKINTNFGGYWQSSNSTPNPVKPNNSHDLLAFTWNGTSYSTGVNNPLLTTNGQIFQPTNFRAFAGDVNVNAIGSSTFIGVGRNYGGVGNVSPVPVQTNLPKYITDGVNGLDMGTAIFNFPVSGLLQFAISSIDPSSINDGVPDVILTQMGDISNVVDQYYFVDINNNVVGNKYLVNFGTVPSIGSADWKFYNANVDPPSYNAGVSNNPTRLIRMLAFDWSELGLNAGNITQVTKFVQVFSGQSDAAFTAYNTTSIALKTSVSGFVFNDNNGGIPNGTPYANATVRLKNALGNTVSTTTTDATGKYLFDNVSGGNYTIELQIPAGFAIVGNVNGLASNTIPITVSTDPILGRNFGINQPPTANNVILTTEANTPISANITTNDTDPNGGAVVPSTVDLIAPPSATNIFSNGGLVKGFTIAGEGTWLVNNAGILAFTPVTGFFGDATNILYTIKDNAGLTSNQALISIKVEEFCYRPGSTSGAVLDTTFGITSLGRAGAENGNWPLVRKGGWMALESKTKGLVINRIATTVAVNAIPDPVEGMLVYDIEAACLKMFTSTDNEITFAWKCMNKQTCPQD